MASEGNMTDVAARFHEAFLTLLMDLAEIAAADIDEKHVVPTEHIKRLIGAAMHRALKIAI